MLDWVSKSPVKNWFQLLSWFISRQRWVYWQDWLQDLHQHRKMLLVRKEQVMPHIPVLRFHTSQLSCKHVVLQRMWCAAGNFHHPLSSVDDSVVHGDILLLSTLLLLQKENLESSAIRESWFVREEKRKEGLLRWWGWRGWWIEEWADSQKIQPATRERAFDSSVRCSWT